MAFELFEFMAARRVARKKLSLALFHGPAGGAYKIPVPNTEHRSPNTKQQTPNPDQVTKKKNNPSEPATSA